MLLLIATILDILTGCALATMSEYTGVTVSLQVYYYNTLKFY